MYSIHCVQVVQQLASDSVDYRHIFSVRTQYKNSERTYYLAAETEEEMNRWVLCLCRVLQLDDNRELNRGRGASRARVLSVEGHYNLIRSISG